MKEKEKYQNLSAFYISVSTATPFTTFVMCPRCLYTTISCRQMIIYESFHHSTSGASYLWEKAFCWLCRCTLINRQRWINSIMCLGDLQSFNKRYPFGKRAFSDIGYTWMRRPTRSHFLNRRSGTRYDFQNCTLNNLMYLIFIQQANIGTIFAITVVSLGKLAGDYITLELGQFRSRSSITTSRSSIESVANLTNNNRILPLQIEQTWDQKQVRKAGTFTNKVFSKLEEN